MAGENQPLSCNRAWYNHALGHFEWMNQDLAWWLLRLGTKNLSKPVWMPWLSVKSSNSLLFRVF